MIQWVAALHPDEETVLRAMRQRQNISIWRCKDVSEQAELPYGRAWRALVRLQRRGYAHQDLLRRWWVAWEKVALPHRAQVSLEPAGPDQTPWIVPSAWERALDWVLRHFGGELGVR